MSRRMNAVDVGNLRGKTDFETTVDAADSENQETYYSPEWKTWKGYYDSVGILQAEIDKKAMWTVGRGFTADEKTSKELKKIRGFGKDTFNTIMNNMVRTYTICGDAFAEIITNARNDLRNLKPLAAESMRIYTNRYGKVERYEQWLDGEKTAAWKPDEILHLPWQRLNDAAHGIGTIEKLEDTVLKIKEAQDDLQTVFHRYVVPQHIFHLDTDDTSEIQSFKRNADKAVAKRENLYIPSNVAEKLDRVSIPQYSTLDPLPWMRYLQEQFIIAEGIPEVILGYGRETTEASAKILYLGFQQVVEFNQLFLEEQLKAQVNLDVEFEFPETIVDDLQSDERKDGEINSTKKSEVEP